MFYVSGKAVVVGDEVTTESSHPDIPAVVGVVHRVGRVALAGITLIKWPDGTMSRVDAAALIKVG